MIERFKPMVLAAMILFAALAILTLGSGPARAGYKCHAFNFSNYPAKFSIGFTNVTLAPGDSRIIRFNWSYVMKVVLRDSEGKDISTTGRINIDVHRFGWISTHKKEGGTWRVSYGPENSTKKQYIYLKPKD